MKGISLLFAIFCYTLNLNAQNCTTGDCENGKGTFIWERGETYTGDWKNGKRDGKGAFSWPNGDVYIGDWIADVQSGSCVYNFADGKKYIGTINNGDFEEGNFILANGYQMKGHFKNGVGITVKYYDNKNIEVSKDIYNEFERNEAAKIKEKLQIQNVTIPGPNGVYTMTDRADEIKMQFSTTTRNLFYIWGNKPTVYTANDAKIIGHSNETTLKQSEIGREILADFNTTSSTTNSSVSKNFNQKGEGYANNKFQIRINRGKPFGINNDSTYTVTLYNYQKFIDDETISNFGFWKNADERKAYHKRTKEEYFDFLAENATKGFEKRAKDEYKEKGRTKLTDVHAKFDSITRIAHVVFTFSYLIDSRSYNLMYDINFKDKTYKKVAESEYQATVNDGCYSYVASRVVDKTTKETFDNVKIINFDSNSIIDIDKAYLAKLNTLTNPPADVKFIAANKNYILFNSDSREKVSNRDGYYGGTSSYYFVNKKNNFCEKIVGITYQKYRAYDIVFNSDFSLAAFSQKYKLNPNDGNNVNSVYVIDFKNLSVKLLDDHQYQMDAINNKIIQDQEDKRQSDIRDFERYQITKRNKEIEEQNAAAQAERTAKCLCCHGTGQVESKGMYLGQQTIRTVSTDGLRTVKDNVVATYGQSSYSICGCCRR